MSERRLVRSTTVENSDGGDHTKYHQFLHDVSNRIEDLVNDYKSPWKARCEFMGFSFEPLEITYASFDVATRHMNFHMRMNMRCVCGRVETFNKVISLSIDFALGHHASELGQMFDPWRALTFDGGNGPNNPLNYEHLVNDGYTPEEAQEIVNRGKMWDNMQDPSYEVYRRRFDRGQPS